MATNSLDGTVELPHTSHDGLGWPGMSDVFISYKKEERAVAELLARRLTEAGYDVWWDAAILAGEPFEKVISNALDAAKAVIVLWSRKAVASRWVIAEAAEAFRQDKPVPALIDDVPHSELPLTYRPLQCPRLLDWNGDTEVAAFQELLASLATKAGAPAGPRLTGDEASAKLDESAREAQMWAAITQSPRERVQEYEAYLAKYGDAGIFSALARIRIEDLKQGTRQTSKPSPLLGPRGNDSDTAKRKTDWRPAIYIPLVTAAVIVVAGVLWYLWAYTELLILPWDRDAAQRCEVWAGGAGLERKTGIPIITDSKVAEDCATAAQAYHEKPRYVAMRAMVEISRDQAGKAVADAIMADNADDPMGQYVLGLMKEFGTGGMQKQPVDAQEDYLEAWKQNLVRAGSRYCLIAIQLGQVDDAAEKICSDAADKNDPQGQLAMGLISEFALNPKTKPGGSYNHPINVSGDDQAAEKLYRLAATQGDFTAMIMLGAELVRGAFVEQNYSEAFTWFSKAAAAEYPEGRRWLGIAYELGLGTTADVVAAGKQYEQARLADDLIATLLIGGKPMDNVRASDISPSDKHEINRLVIDANAVALRMTGQSYQYGLSQRADKASQLQSFLSCASDNAFCQLAAGDYYLNATGEDQNVGKGVELLKTAAASGEMHAQFELGVLLDRGGIVPVDHNEGLRLIKLAASQGNADARAYLANTTSGETVTGS